MSALQWSVGLFMAGAAFHMFIGVATPIVTSFYRGDALYFTQEVDSQAFGHDTGQWMDDEPGLERYRQAMMLTIAAFLVMLATVEGAVTWYGLREGATWAAGALAVVTVSGIGFWTMVLGQYWTAGVYPQLSTIPPFIWVPSALFVPASILAWIAVETP